MYLARAVLLMSLLFNLGVVGIAIYSESSVKSEFQNYGPGEWVQALLMVALILSIPCLPWLKAFRLTVTQTGQFGAIIFSVLTSVSCAFIFLPKPSGPSEALGVYVIIQILVVWFCYFVSLSSGKSNNAS